MTAELVTTMRTGLTEPEARALNFWEARFPEQGAAFLAAVPLARETVLIQLTAALWREDWGALASSAEPAAGHPPMWRQVTYGEADSLLVPIAGHHAFGRVRLAGPPALVRGSQLHSLGHPSELLAWLSGHPAAAGLAISRLERELTDACANLAMAYTYWEAKRRRLGILARAEGAADTVALAGVLARHVPGFDAGVFFESFCVEGHPLHPCAKTRLGLGPEAVVLYGPEFDGTCPVRLVALSRSLAAWHGEGEPNHWLKTDFPELEAPVAAALRARGLQLGEVVLVPVHPWQADRALPEIYADELASGDVTLLEGIELPCAPTASYRTVVPASRRRGATLKLAVNSQMTSSMRSISPETAHNGPTFTKLIGEVMAREPRLAARYVPVGELAGVSFKATDEARRRNLTALWREPLSELLAPSEAPVCASALYARSPLSDRPILAELVETHGRAHGGLTGAGAALAFVRAYAELLLPGALTLLVKYGIALEAHMQNCVLGWADDRPSRLFFRDWGGLRLNRPRLAAQGLTLDFLPGSITICDDMDAVRDKAFYTLYQNHLAEVVWRASVEFGASEAAMWDVVAEVGDAVFDELASDPTLAEQAREDQAALKRPVAMHKALATMRLAVSGGDRYVSVSNPLAEEARG